jgi:hypothetical protein
VDEIANELGNHRHSARVMLIHVTCPDGKIKRNQVTCLGMNPNGGTEVDKLKVKVIMHLAKGSNVGTHQPRATPAL